MNQINVPNKPNKPNAPVAPSAPEVVDEVAPLAAPEDAPAENVPEVSLPPVAPDAPEEQPQGGEEALTDEDFFDSEEDFSDEELMDIVLRPCDFIITESGDDLILAKHTNGLIADFEGTRKEFAELLRS